MRLIIYAAWFFLLFGCNPEKEHNSQQTDELTTQEISDSVRYAKGENSDTIYLADLYPSLKGKVYKSESIGVKLMHSRKFKVDSNLEYYLPITLTNMTDNPIIGVSLIRVEDMVLGHYELGKHKLNIKPHKSTSLRLSLQTMKLNEDVLEKTWAIGSLMVSEVYYADGTYSSNKIKY